MTGELKNPDRHTAKSGMLTRPDPELRQRVQEVLKADDWTADEYFIACMKLLLTYKPPSKFLDFLAENGLKPPRKPRGRPRKST